MPLSFVENKNESQRQKLVNAGKFHNIHWVILCLSALLTVLAWYFANEQVNQKVEERFQRESNHIIELVKDRMTLYEQALWGVVSLYAASDKQFGYVEFKKYATRLHIDETYPGINGIGIIYHIKPAQLPSYLANKQVERPNFTIHPKHQQNEYWPITYIEPEQKNNKAIGLDMAFETSRYTAIKKARDTGLAQLTGPITLVQDDKNTPGFLFFTPFYKHKAPIDTIEARQKNIVGVSYAPFIMFKLISGTLAIENRLVTIKISDQGHVLYDDRANTSTENIDNTPLYKETFKVDFYGRVWAFDIESNLAFKQASESYQPILILFSGIIIDFLILGLFIFLTRANRQALMYADSMNDELKIKTKRLEKSNHDLEEFAYVASHDLKSPLNAMCKLVNWLKEDCIDILPESSLKHIELLENRSERMSNLLNDLLDYARIERFDYKPETIQLATSVKEVFSLLDHDDNVTLTITNNVELIFPRIPFEIILRNLISNAIKHHDKPVIKITVSYVKENNMHKISIEDNGPGIPPELFNKAIEMFQTLKPRDKVEGTGMGLALVNKITLHYGGKLTIESDGICGTRINILLPLQLK